VFSSCRLGEVFARFQTMDVATMVHGQVEFTIDLYKAVLKGKESDNVVLSPLSINLALAMISAGAKGPTLEQIAKCIKLPEGEPMHNFSSQLRTVVLADGSDHGGPQLARANRAWVEQTVKLKPKFQKVLKDSYGSEAASVDFLTKVRSRCFLQSMLSQLVIPKFDHT
jgi:serpin B